MDDLVQALKAIFKIGAAIAQAIVTGDRSTVDDVLPDSLKTDLVAAGKELEAIEKFGPRNPRI